MPKPKKSTKPTDKERLDWLALMPGHVWSNVYSQSFMHLRDAKDTEWKDALRMTLDAFMAAERRDKKKARG